MKIIEKRFKGKAIYNPQGKAGEYSQWACNFFMGCSHNCDYCYCKRGFMSRLWSRHPRIKKGLKDIKTAMRIFEKELLKNLPALQKSSLFFTFSSDPFLPESAELTWQAMLLALRYDVPVQLLTKRADFINHSSCIAMEKFRDKVAFGFTLTGHDEREPGASTNLARVKAMRSLHLRGFKTFASIEPVIDVEHSLSIIKPTIGYCDLYKIGLMSGGGVKYNAIDVLLFVQTIHEMLPETSKIYWKESIRKLVAVNALATDFDHASAVVDADYDIFGRTEQ